ncbi:hypothetical protein EVA_03097 [gut metagenome]|uniref:Uncharacterized protein n=1 Tax=gut metagenome TaxID=749906 RepID=J9D7N6_9ZZZZ
MKQKDISIRKAFLFPSHEIITIRQAFSVHCTFPLANLQGT